MHRRALVGAIAVIHNNNLRLHQIQGHGYAVHSGASMLVTWLGGSPEAERGLPMAPVYLVAQHTAQIVLSSNVLVLMALTLHVCCAAPDGPRV